MAAKPPDEVSDKLKEDVAKLHKPLAAILVGGRIGIRHGGGPGGPLGHPSRENGPRDLRFRDGENGFNVQTLAFTAMRLLQAVRVAASLVRGGNQGDHPAARRARRRRPWRSSKGVMATSRSSGV